MSVWVMTSPLTIAVALRRLGSCLPMSVIDWGSSSAPTDVSCSSCVCCAATLPATSSKAEVRAHARNPAFRGADVHFNPVKFLSIHGQAWQWAQRLLNRAG